MPSPHAVTQGQTVAATRLDSTRNNTGNIGNTQTKPDCKKDPGTIGRAHPDFDVINATGATQDIIVSFRSNLSGTGTSPQLAALFKATVNGAARNVTGASITAAAVTLTVDGAALSSGDIIDVTFVNDDGTAKIEFTTGGLVPDFRFTDVSI